MSPDDEGSPSNAVLLTPYAQSLGVVVSAASKTGAPVLALDFGSHIEGRPGHLHGGSISGLLETAGYAALQAKLAAAGIEAQLKPINITVQFLRAGKPKRSFARGRITKLGKRTANLTVEAWQDAPDNPIATAVLNVLIAGTRDTGGT